MKHLIRPPRHIVLATDFTERARVAFDAAVRAAWLFEAKLHVLHVNEEELYFATHDSRELASFLDNVARRRIDWLEQLEEEARGLGLDAVAATRQGAASEGIIAYADEVDAGLIVLATVGARGLREMLTGSTARRVLRHAERPVLVISPRARVRPAEEGGTFDHVLYPTDLSPASHAGLKVAELLATRSGAGLTLAHVLKLPTVIPTLPGEPPLVLPQGAIEGTEARLRSELESVVAALKVPREVNLAIEVHGDAAEGIAEVADREGVDLIAIPRHSGRSVRGFLFGHTAEHLAKMAPAPVLAFTPLEG